MNEQRVPYWVPLELYTPSRVLSGYIRCLRELRLLDLLNGEGSAEYGVNGFFEFVDTSASGEEPTHQERLREYIRKTAVELIATSDVNLARGAGAKSGAKGYPFVAKSTVPVSLQLPTYTLSGCAHCSPGQSLYDVLNEDSLFIPLTDVTIAHQYGLHATRPFAAVNKEQVTSSWEEDPAMLAPL
jgi:hypothetical protein